MKCADAVQKLVETQKQHGTSADVSCNDVLSIVF
jgi:hypothetical protein